MTEQTPQNPATGENSTPTPPEQPAAPQPPAQEQQLAPQPPAQEQQLAPQPPASQFPAPQQYPAPQQQPYPAPQQPATSQYCYAEQPVPAAPIAPAAAGMPQAQQPTNTLAILSLILSFVVAPAGIVTGHIALNKIKQTGEPGRGLALAGTIVGYVLTGFAVIGTIIAIMFSVLLGGIALTAADSGIQQLEEFEEYSTPDFGTERPSGDLLDTPEKVLEAWQPCALALEIDTNDGDAFYDDIEWLAAHEALARLMDPSAEADAIRTYVDYLVTNDSFDYNLTAAYVDALAASSAKLCTQ